MSVYIEYVIIDNLVITALICFVTYRILKAGKHKLRTLFASLSGTAAAVCYPFINVHFVLLLLIKFALYLTLCIILFIKKPYFFKGAAVFLLVTAAFGGIMFMGGFLVYGDVYKALTLPAYDFPLGLILLIPLILYFIFKKVVSNVIKHRNIKDYSYKIEFSVFDKTVRAKGFLDSGNLLLDEKTGLPVIVLSGGISGKILSDNQLEMILKDKGESICKSARYIKFDTINKGGRILVLKPQKFLLYYKDGANILKEVMLGLTFNGLGGGFDALLSPALF